MAINNKKRIVVIGGSGFIGSNLLCLYLKDSDYELINISRGNYKMDGIISYQGNFADKRFLSRVIKEGDVIIHLACTTVPLTSEENKKDDYEQNVLGTNNLLEICAEKKVDKIVFMSSGGTVYGDHGVKKVEESSVTDPVSHHGKMKLEIEKNILDYKNFFGLNYLIIRASNPFGRVLGMHKASQGVIEAFLRQGIVDNSIVIWGGGEQVRDFLYIDDFVQAIKLLIESGIENEIVNVGSGRGLSISCIAKLVQDYIGKKVDIIHKPSRSFDVMYNVLETKKLKSIIDWSAKTSVEEGIQKMIKNYSL